MRITHRRSITTKSTRFDLEIEQSQPVTQAPVSDELTFLGQIQIAEAATTIQMGPALAQTPQTDWIHTRDNDPAFGHQHAFDFAQRGMRVCMQLQSVGQHDKVQAVGGKGQCREVTDQRHLPYARLCALTPIMTRVTVRRPDA